MKNKTSFLKSSLLTLSVTALIGCGGASTDSNDNSTLGQSTTDQPVTDQLPVITPPSDTIFATLMENEEVLATSRLRSNIDDENSILTVILPLSTPKLTTIELDDGTQITDADEIKNYFSIEEELKNNNGVFNLELEIAIHKMFNYESDSKSYKLFIDVGDEVKTIIVNIFDEQNGTSDEPLIISNYSELLAFFKGTFYNEVNKAQEVIALANPTSTSHNTNNFHIELDRDIDASVSKDTLWQARAFEGVLNGNHHTITSLHTNNGFITTSKNAHTSSIKNIGFVDARFKRIFISLTSTRNSSLDSVFVSGYATPTPAANTTVSATPFAASNITKVYSNIFWDLSNLQYLQFGRHQISGLLGTTAAPIFVHSGYANVAMNTVSDGRLRGTFAGIAASQSIDFYQAPLNTSQIFSAVAYSVTSNQIKSNGRALTEAGGLLSLPTNLPAGITPSADDFRWRFITDRNGNVPVRSVGLNIRDTNNNGIPDININHSDVHADFTGAGLTEQEAKQANRLAGS